MLMRLELFLVWITFFLLVVFSLVVFSPFGPSGFPSATYMREKEVSRETSLKSMVPLISV